MELGWWLGQGMEGFYCVRKYIAIVVFRERIDDSGMHFWELGLRETGVLDDMLDEVGRRLLMDSYYHSNKPVGTAMEKGYIPLVRPHTRGYYRRKSRKLFGVLADNYRYRPRGESTFGPIINEFGDRIKTRRYDTTATRIIARLIPHLAKTLIRIKKAIMEFLDTLIYGHDLYAHVSSLKRAFAEDKTSFEGLCILGCDVWCFMARRHGPRCMCVWCRRRRAQQEDDDRYKSLLPLISYLAS